MKSADDDEDEEKEIFNCDFCGAAAFVQVSWSQERWDSDLNGFTEASQPDFSFVSPLSLAKLACLSQLRTTGDYFLSAVSSGRT